MGKGFKERLFVLRWGDLCEVFFKDYILCRVFYNSINFLYFSNILVVSILFKILYDVNV